MAHPSLMRSRRFFSVATWRRLELLACLPVLVTLLGGLSAPTSLSGSLRMRLPVARASRCLYATCTIHCISYSSNR